MGISKVVRKNTGEVLVDLTNDTVTAETLADGVTAHDKKGEIITGKMLKSGYSTVDQLQNSQITIILI